MDETSSNQPDIPLDDISNNQTIETCDSERSSTDMSETSYIDTHCMICLDSIKKNDSYAMADTEMESVRKYHIECIEEWTTKHNRGIVKEERIISYTIFKNLDKISVVFPIGQPVDEYEEFHEIPCSRKCKIISCIVITTIIVSFIMLAIVMIFGYYVIK